MTIAPDIDTREHERFRDTGVNGTAVAVVNPDGSVISATGGATIPPVTTPTIYNVSITLANTEYSQALSATTKRFTIKIRDIASLKLAYVSGQSGTTFISVPGGASYEEINLAGTGAITLYFQSPTASQVAEIVQWE